MFVSQWLSEFLELGREADGVPRLRHRMSLTLVFSLWQFSRAFTCAWSPEPKALDSTFRDSKSQGEDQEGLTFHADSQSIHCAAPSGMPLAMTAA